MARKYLTQIKFRRDGVPINDEADPIPAQSFRHISDAYETVAIYKTEEGVMMRRGVETPYQVLRVFFKEKKA